jgi:hypothetical protein
MNLAKRRLECSDHQPLKFMTCLSLEQMELFRITSPPTKTASTSTFQAFCLKFLAIVLISLTYDAPPTAALC